MQQDQSIKFFNYIQAVQEFLDDNLHEIAFFTAKLRDLEKLEEEREVASTDAQKTNIKTQLDKFEEVLTRYKMLEDDVDINGQRVRLIIEKLLYLAKKHGMKDVLKEKKKIFRL